MGTFARASRLPAGSNTIARTLWVPTSMARMRSAVIGRSSRMRSPSRSSVPIREQHARVHQALRVEGTDDGLEGGHPERTLLCRQVRRVVRADTVVVADGR